MLGRSLDEAHRYLPRTHNDMQAYWQEAQGEPGLSMGDVTLSGHEVPASLGSPYDKDKERTGLLPSANCSPYTWVPQAPGLFCAAHRASPSTGVQGTSESLAFLFFLGVSGVLPFCKPSSHKSKALAIQNMFPKRVFRTCFERKKQNTSLSFYSRFNNPSSP